MGGIAERRRLRAAQRWKANGVLAEWTGLEPATPGVTGRYSNQLNYHSDDAAVAARRFLQDTAVDDAIHPAMRRPGELVGAERLELPTFAL